MATDPGRNIKFHCGNTYALWKQRGWSCTDAPQLLLWW